MTSSLPSLFVSHGAPTLYLEAQSTRTFLMELGRTLPRPDAVLCLSAHWTTARPMVTLSPSPDTIHDFGGFPDELYRVRYPAPGAPELAGRVLNLLDASGIEASGHASRGMDHGAWVPLGLMYPEADIPVVQLSVQPGSSPEFHSRLGRALADLRREGVLVVGSGGATHNLADVRWGEPDAAPPRYVAAFDAWLKSAVWAGRVSELENYLTSAPHGRENHPTPEHFLPLFAPMAMGGRPRLAHEAFSLGVLSMAAFLWE